jgi:hypothetical protein
MQDQLITLTYKAWSISSQNANKSVLNNNSASLSEKMGQNYVGVQRITRYG